jgi:hypothetical protein
MTTHPNSSEQLLENIETSDLENDSQAFSQLIFSIMNFYNRDLTDWQKIKIAYAIAAYKTNWLYLCKFSLTLALENPEKISKDPLYASYKDIARKIDIEKLISEI